MHALPLPQAWYDWSGTGFYFAGTWQGIFSTKTPLVKAYGRTSREFTYWRCFYLEEPELCPSSEVKGLREMKTNDD